MNRLILACICAMCAGPVRGETPWSLDRTVEVSAGVFFLDTDTTLRVDATRIDRGTSINLEKDLGLTHTDRFRIDGYWRIFPRHRLRAMYFDSSARSARQLQRDIEFADVVFPLNVRITADFDLTILEAAYEYAFLKRDSYEIAGSVGIHGINVEMQLAAQASANPGQGGVDLARLAEATGPMPVVGVRGTWAFGNHYSIDAQVQFFDLKFDNYDGSLQDYKLAFNWMPWRHVGFGIGYNASAVRLDIDETNYLGRVRLDYGGAMVFLTGAF